MIRIPQAIGKTLVSTAFALFSSTLGFSQGALSIPAWLQSYPGATAAVHSSDSLIESSYTTAAAPEQIVAHYGKLFEAAKLPFHPNPDGMGTSIRAEAPECDLLIQIRRRDEGAFVKVNCSAKTQPDPAASPGDVKVISSRPQSTRIPSTAAASGRAPMIPDKFMERHRQKVADMGIHREHHDAPAPPLVWPAWLGSVTGAALRPEAGVDQSKNAMLKARYTTNAPMSEIYKFYRESLQAHDYPTRSQLSTGQTMSGVLQNALGYVEGSNYPDGAPGASTEIRVSFSRDVLNGPITVSLRFTTHEYIVKRGY
jgi:hypothetical protein